MTSKSPSVVPACRRQHCGKKKFLTLRSRLIPSTWIQRTPPRLRPARNLECLCLNRKVLKTSKAAASNLGGKVSKSSSGPWTSLPDVTRGLRLTTAWCRACPALRAKHCLPLLGKSHGHGDLHVRRFSRAAECGACRPVGNVGRRKFSAENTNAGSAATSLLRLQWQHGRVSTKLAASWLRAAALAALRTSPPSCLMAAVRSVKVAVAWLLL